MTAHIVGIRHHSPACARLVAQTIANFQPNIVLIEGPSDFNARIDELLLAHQLPIAIYSYTQTVTPDNQPSIAQCWFPLLEYSPEWVALQHAQKIGASIRFIDLPHWSYRATGNQQINAPDPYTHTHTALRQQFHCDSDDALWDHLFESAPLEQLQTRLTDYFTTLRHSQPAPLPSSDTAAIDPEQQRERFMAQHIAAAILQNPESKVLVVCGGWHKPALEQLIPYYLKQNNCQPPATPEIPEQNRGGSYLVPYEFRQVESLAGYSAGMQSPQFYQWCWQHDAKIAMNKALATVITHLRQRKIPLSSADFIALQTTLTGLAQMRGHHPPQRVDLLDAVLNSVLKEALDCPPPWARHDVLRHDDHPILRETMLALTGDTIGKLHPNTPHPPLLQQVEQQLQALELMPELRLRKIVLDRRNPDDRPRAESLWQLKLLQIQGVELNNIAKPQTNKSLPEPLYFEEHWQIVKGTRWYPDLIQASRFGPTLAQAAENALLIQLAQDRSNVPLLANTLIEAIRAGFENLSQTLNHELHTAILELHDHGALAVAGEKLLQLQRTGFWGQNLTQLLQPTLHTIGEHLLWLLEGRQTSDITTLEQDIQAVCFITGLHEVKLPQFDHHFALSTLQRIAKRHDAPYTLRGAALGAVYVAGQFNTQQVLDILLNIPAQQGLGDFLYGLFSQARKLLTTESTLLETIQQALEQMPNEAFLIALPTLRGAFTWFPPRERGQIATHIAKILQLNPTETAQIQHLPSSEHLLNAKQIEAQAVQWAKTLGLDNA